MIILRSGLDYASLLPGGVMVARLVLAQLVGVRVPAGQPMRLNVLKTKELQIVDRGHETKALQQK